MSSISLNGNEPSTNTINYSGKLNSLSLNVNSDYSPETSKRFTLVILPKDRNGIVIGKTAGTEFRYDDSQYVINDYIENFLDEIINMFGSETAQFELIFDFENRVWYIDDEIKGVLHTDKIKTIIIGG